MRSAAGQPAGAPRGVPAQSTSRMRRAISLSPTNGDSTPLPPGSKPVPACPAPPDRCNRVATRNPAILGQAARVDVPGRPAHLPPLTGAAPLPGGLVCTVLGGMLADGRPVVVKLCPYPAEVEADGLAALAGAGAPVPAVLAAAGDLLVLDRVAGPPDWAGLGRSVARLHRTTGPRYGWHRDNSGGRITQHNGWHDRWNDFFVANRVRVHLADPAVPDALRRRLERACAGPLPALLPEHPPASLTHGDLWSGNVVGGRWLVDPAVAYVDRELELAFMDMADLPVEFHDAYRREWPVDPGYPQRRPALQLHKLLVNLRHFGERYVPRIEAVLDGSGGDHPARSAPPGSEHRRDDAGRGRG